MNFTSRIAGTGSAFPKRVVTNAELCREIEARPGETVEGFSPEWVVERTGIETRHFAAADETTSELATRASRLALTAAGVDATALDGVILATCTPDQAVPAAATLVQAKLGATTAFAFDVNAACSGFHHAWAIAHAMIAAGQAKTLLVIGADVATSITDFSDRKSAILFGDGAGAMVLQRSEASDTDAGRNEPKFSLSADGTQRDLLEIPRGERHLRMKGPEIFKSSIRTMVGLADELLAKLDLTAADVDFVVPHQANLRILERVAKQQRIGMDKFILNIATRGNTSAATVPTALDDGIRSGRIRRGHRLLVPVFGAGVTAGAAVVIY